VGSGGHRRWACSAQHTGVWGQVVWLAPRVLQHPVLRCSRGGMGEEVQWAQQVEGLQDASAGCLPDKRPTLAL